MTTYHIFYSPLSTESTEVVYDDLSLNEAHLIFVTLVSTVRFTGGDVRLLDDNLHIVACWNCPYDKDQIPQAWEAEITHLSRRMELIQD